MTRQETCHDTALRHDSSARDTTQRARGMGSRSRYNFCIVIGERPLVSRYGAARLRYSVAAPFDMAQERYDTHDSTRDTARNALGMGLLRHDTILYCDKGAATRRYSARMHSETWQEALMTRRLVRHDTAQCGRPGPSARAAWVP